MSTSYLMDLFQLEISQKSEIQSSGELGEPLATVLEFAKRQQGFVKAAQVQRGNSNMVDASTNRKISTTRIRRYFGLLADMGYGELEGDGERLKFRAY